MVEKGPALGIFPGPQSADIHTDFYGSRFSGACAYRMMSSGLQG